MDKLSMLQDLWRSAREHDWHYTKSDSWYAYEQGRQGWGMLCRQAEALGEDGKRLMDVMSEWGMNGGECPDPPGVDLSTLRRDLKEAAETELCDAQWWWHVHECLTLADIMAVQERWKKNR